MQSKTNQPNNQPTNQSHGRKKAKKNQKSERGKTTNTGDVSEGNYGRYEKGGNGLQVTTSLYGIDFLFDQRDQDGGDFQAVLAYWVVHARHMGRFLIFSVSTVEGNFGVFGFFTYHVLGWLVFVSIWY
jgi:hypothetical protein